MGQRSSDGDKLSPSSVSSSRGPAGLDHRTNSISTMDDDDKLLDVVGPPQSPLLSLSQQMQHHAGTFDLNFYRLRASVLMLILFPLHFTRMVQL